ncbi:hypothetical protein DV738_g2054, partial [Chaetothyriales sp. CBS 135597]
MSFHHDHDLNPIQTQLPTPAYTPQAMDRDEQSAQTSYAHHSSSWTPVDSMTPISTNPSRKRSRDDISYDPDTDGSYFPSTDMVNTPAPIPEEPIYGEGMVLLNPRSGYSISAESQTGTWLEEKQDREKLEEEIRAANFRPQLPTCRKAARLSQTAIKASITPASADINGAPASPPKSAATNPEPDDAAIALGISWTQVATDESIQSAARGWARYIDNHYARHIHGAGIVLKNTAHDAYLVRCHEGFFLFSENLLEGQLVATSWDRCLDNLKSYPFVFDGTDRLRAERTPGPDVEAAASGTLGSTQPQPQPQPSQQSGNSNGHNSLDKTESSLAVDNATDVALSTNGRMDID